MSSNIHQTSAKIYQFPRRLPGTASRGGFETAASRDVRQQRPLNIEYGSAWYHQTAIDESQRVRKP